jgi:hypothetical protein
VPRLNYPALRAFGNVMTHVASLCAWSAALHIVSTAAFFVSSSCRLYRRCMALLT